MDEKRNPIKLTARAVTGLWEAFATVLRHLFRRPVTEEYPDYKRPLPARSRARIILTRDPTVRSAASPAFCAPRSAR